MEYNKQTTGLKPIDASLIPGVSILKKQLKMPKSGARMILHVQVGPTRSDEHNRRALAIEELGRKIKENMKQRGLKFSLHAFTIDLIERELKALADHIGIDRQP